MRRTHLVVLLLLAVLAGVGLGDVARTWYSARSVVPPAEEQRTPIYYRHPMDPSISSPVPAKDSMGMDYLPVYADGAAGADAPSGVVISAAVRQSLGVRTAPARRAVLGGTVRATGVLAWDESRLVHLHTRAPGWVSALHVHTVGDVVRAGQVLATLDSNVLDAAQREHLVAAGAADAALLAASRARLAALGMTPEQVTALEQSRASSRAIAVRAPADGVITALGARHGMYVTPATELFALAAQDPVWVDAEVLERQAALLRGGERARIEVPGQPDAPRTAKVAYVYPQLDPATRAQRVRLVVPNPDHALRPGMWVAVDIEAAAREVLAVPAEAVIRTGDGERVVLALPDGRFDVRAVRTGAALGDAVEVLEGLAQDDTVVVSGQFLLDTEASTAAALAALEGASAPAPGAAREPASEAPPEPAHEPAPGSSGAAPGATSEAQTPAVVRAVDAAARVVTLEHPAIDAIGMPAMTMDFPVLAHVPLAGLRAGDPLRVHLRLTEHGYVLTAIEPAP